MAIERYSANGVRVPVVPLPRQDAGGIGSVTGNVLTRVADATAGMADERTRKALAAQQEADAQQQRTEAAKRLAQFRQDQIVAFHQAREGADAGAPEFTKLFLEGYDKAATNLLDGVTEPEMRDYLDRAALEFRTSLLGDALSFEAGARSAKKEGDLSEALDLNRNLVASRPDQFQAVLGQSLAVIEASGLPASKIEAYKRAAMNDLATSAIGGAIDLAPQQVLKDLRGGAWDSFVDPDRKLAFINQAEAEIKRRQEEARRAQREAEAAAREQRALLRLEASAAMASFASGQEYAGAEDMQRRLDAADPAAGTEFRIARGNLGWVQEAQRMSPDDLAAELTQLGAEIAATKDATAAKVLSDRQAAGIATLDRAVAGLTKDPLGYAESVGVVPATAAPLDSVEGFKARTDARAAFQAHYGFQPPLLRPDERAEIVRRWSGAANADARMQALQPLIDVPGPWRNQVLDEVMSQKGGEALGLAASLALEDPAAARDMLAGMDAAQNIKGVIPENSADLRAAIDRQLGQAFAFNPAARAAATDAALFLYAQGSATAGDTTGALDEKRLADAIQRATGGLIEFKGAKLVAPVAGMDEAAFGDLVDAVTDADLGRQQAVYATGEKVSAFDIRTHASFQNSGSGTFFVLFDGAPVFDKLTGRPVEIDLAKVARRQQSGVAP